MFEVTRSADERVAEYFLHRTIEPDHPTGRGLSLPSQSLLCAPQAAAGRPSGAAAMPLQLPKAAPCSEFGREVRTPAMQAGLSPKRLTFRDVFTSIPTFLRLAKW